MMHSTLQPEAAFDQLDRPCDGPPGRYCVEFGHIYADEVFGQEQRGGVKAYRAWADSTAVGAHTSVVLVDDYNVDQVRTPPDEVLSHLVELGAQPDYLVRESLLAGPALGLLESLNDGRVGRATRSYFERKGKLPCSLMTAAFYLSRLGHLEHAELFVNARKPWRPADQLVNILPRRYMEVESKAIAIIRASDNRLAADRIAYVWHG